MRFLAVFGSETLMNNIDVGSSSLSTGAHPASVATFSKADGGEVTGCFGGEGALLPSQFEVTSISVALA